MSKVIVNEFIARRDFSGSGRPGRDTSGGFRHGRWHMPYGAGSGVAKIIGEAGGYLLGRRTYEIFARYWPTAPEDVKEIAAALNTKPKHVASRRHTGLLEWQNVSVLPGTVPEAVAALKDEDGGDLLVLGSTVLVQSPIQLASSTSSASWSMQSWSAVGSGSSRTTVRFGCYSSSITGDQHRLDHHDLRTCLVLACRASSRRRRAQAARITSAMTSVA